MGAQEDCGPASLVPDGMSVMGVLFMDGSGFIGLRLAPIFIAGSFNLADMLLVRSTGLVALDAVPLLPLHAGHDLQSQHPQAADEQIPAEPRFPDIVRAQWELQTTADHLSAGEERASHHPALLPVAVKMMVRALRHRGSLSAWFSRRLVVAPKLPEGSEIATPKGFQELHFVLTVHRIQPAFSGL
ncbi:hypothetical protein OKA04_15800 [Luteolibacter flavescens]|uniref:Uncharacterized protein n=1 Tax=Luteolibacter flavescens TaxID=1859460 RepID=A0ABT3FRN4_9BACT|nr:hypothetical protein [Luteolibacter flavescens]